LAAFSLLTPKDSLSLALVDRLFDERRPQVRLVPLGGSAGKRSMM